LLHDITIEARKDGHAIKCNYFGAALGAGESRRLPCPPETIGRYLRVKKDPSDSGMLVLCEVEVYGTSGT